jgi:hypothetical protein
LHGSGYLHEYTQLVYHANKRSIKNKRKERAGTERTTFARSSASFCEVLKGQNQRGGKGERRRKMKKKREGASERKGVGQRGSIKIFILA